MYLDQDPSPVILPVVYVHDFCLGSSDIQPSSWSSQFLLKTINDPSCILVVQALGKVSIKELTKPKLETWTTKLVCSFKFSIS